MSFKEVCDEIKDLTAPYVYEFNTPETRAAIIDAISEHSQVGAVTDVTTQEDLAKFKVDVQDKTITVTVPLL